MRKQPLALALIAALCAARPSPAFADKPWWDIFSGLRQLVTGPRSQKVRVSSDPGGARIWAGPTVNGRPVPVVLLLNLEALNEVVIRMGSRQMTATRCRHGPPKAGVELLHCVFPH